MMPELTIRRYKGLKQIGKVLCMNPDAVRISIELGDIMAYRVGSGRNCAYYLNDDDVAPSLKKIKERHCSARN